MQDGDNQLVAREGEEDVQLDVQQGDGDGLGDQYQGDVWQDDGDSLSKAQTMSSISCEKLSVDQLSMMGMAELQSNATIIL